MIKLLAPKVTEDDILIGNKTVVVPLRRGKSVEVQISAMPWRLALAYVERHASSEEILTACLPDQVMVRLPHSEDAGGRTMTRDAFLNSVSPRGLFWLTSVAMELTMGLDKPEAAGESDPAEKKSSPASATTSPPSAS